jgi:pyruvate kinase
MRKTLIATLGPASRSRADALAAAGVDAFRLNASHMSPEDVGEAIASLRARLPDLPIVVDLQGAKVRLGELPGGAREVRDGESLTFELAPEPDSDALPLPHPELFRAVRVGDTLGLDDDRVHLRVTRVTGTRLEGSPSFDAVALHDATIRPRKGLNLLDHPLVLDGLTSVDAAHVDAAKGFAHVAFAFSFMLDGREAAWVRARAPGASVVGKIERREAIVALDAIARACDGVWICRGDLGAQLGAAALGRAVAALAPRELACPTLMAGQVLEHLTNHRDPTRSEVCHLHDLLSRGYAGIVLSDETAIGDDPVHAATTARALLDASDDRAV